MIASERSPRPILSTILLCLGGLCAFVVVGSFIFSDLADTSGLQEGNQKAVRAQLNGFNHLLEDFRDQCGNFPTTEQGLNAFVTQPVSAPLCPKYPKGSFLPDGKVPKAPWGNPFIYTSDGKTFKITSLGSDGKEGGEGDAQDISVP
jgi:type II secretion system protein G